MAFLEVDDIKTYYGNIQALKGISIEVNEGECVTLIGWPATRLSTCPRRRSSASASASRPRAASASSA